MPSGRPRKTTGPFLGVGRADNSLYLVELGNGMVKVGFSNNPERRLVAVARFCRRMYQSDVSRFHVYSGAGTRRTEAKCISAVEAVASKVPLTSDYFTDISFDDAKAIVDSILES